LKFEFIKEELIVLFKEDPLNLKIEIQQDNNALTFSYKSPYRGCGFTLSISYIHEFFEQVLNQREGSYNTKNDI
jgi:hypothetical protein